MTRMSSVRDAADRTKDSVRHAAEVVAPYAGTAKDSAAHYADEARQRLAPKVSSAAHQARSAARTQYGTHLAPRIDHARAAVPPRVEAAVETAAERTRKTARNAADYAGPRVEHAVVSARAAAEPVRDEAMARAVAALAALRGQVTAAQIEKLVRRHNRRARAGRFAKRLATIGVVGGAGYTAWAWWHRQTNPDWLVETPEPTEVTDRSSLNGSAPMEPADALDPEVQAKQPEAGNADRTERGDGQV